MPGDHRLMALAAQDAACEAPYSFEEFERRGLRAGSVARRRERIAGLSAAAMIVAALVGGLWLVASRPGVPVAQGRAPAAPPMDAVTAEHWLAAVPAEPVVVRAHSYATVAALEDRLAFIDDRLNDSRMTGTAPDDGGALGRERERLVNALASVRYAQMLAVNFQ